MIAAKKMLLAGKRGRRFALSGSWEATGGEGWTPDASTPASSVNTVARTGERIVRFAAGDYSITYTVPASVAKFNRVTASVYARTHSSPVRFYIEARVGTGAWARLFARENHGGWELYSAAVDNKAELQIQFRIGVERLTNPAQSFLDDWSITGVPL